MDADSLKVLSAVLLQLPPIHSAHICSRLPVKSRNSCRNTQTSSLPTVFQSLHLNMEYSTAPGPPVFAKACDLDPEKLASAKAELLRMEKAGIVRVSSSPWSSPLHMVPKPDSTWRPCGDFCCLNTATVPDRYSLPAVDDFSARRAGSKFFFRN